jgi:D-3-phosphoglycerate dehydrogenase / 2-oxoglutarate reductase
MEILIADAFPVVTVDDLRASGHVVRHEPGLGADGLTGALGTAEILVVRGTVVPGEALESAKALRLVVRAGAGVNTIDVAAASKAGVFVANTPGKNAIAVAELVMGLITAIDRNIPDAVADLRAGLWDKGRYSEAEGLAGRTIGIVGVGDIGLEVARRAAAFDMNVIAVEKAGRSQDVRRRIREIGIRLVPDDATLLAEADIVSLHVPATAETVGLVDAAFLGAMKDGSILVNTSRGDVVDEDALLAALDEKRMRAGLDVFRGEPVERRAAFNSTLASHPRVYGTHHIGASTEQAQRAIAAEVFEIVTAFAAGERRSCVNLVDHPEGDVLTVQHVNRIGVLASVFAVLRDAGINVTTVENRIFTGGETATASIRVDGGLSADVAAAIEALDAVMSVGVFGT